MEPLCSALTDHNLIDLLAGAGRDDTRLRKAITRIFQEYRRPLYHYVLGILRDPEHAEDVTQEVFLRLYTELRGGRRIDNCRAWLFQSAHNLAVDRYRKTSREEFRDERGWAELAARTVADTQDASQTLIDRERHSMLAAALTKLSPQERQAMELRAEGLRYREIAETLGVRISSVQNYLARAVEKLTRRVHA